MMHWGLFKSSVPRSGVATPGWHSKKVRRREKLMIFEKPSFLGKGAFQWNALGYQLTGPFPPNLGIDAALRNSNPWIKFAAVLHRAKTGNFASLSILIDCLREADSWVLAQACAE